MWTRNLRSLTLRLSAASLAVIIPACGDALWYWHSDDWICYKVTGAGIVTGRTRIGALLSHYAGDAIARLLSGVDSTQPIDPMYVASVASTVEFGLHGLLVVAMALLLYWIFAHRLRIAPTHQTLCGSCGFALRNLEKPECPACQASL